MGASRLARFAGRFAPLRPELRTPNARARLAAKLARSTCERALGSGNAAGPQRGRPASIKGNQPARGRAIPFRPKTIKAGADDAGLVRRPRW